MTHISYLNEEVWVTPLPEMCKAKREGGGKAERHGANLKRTGE